MRLTPGLEMRDGWSRGRTTQSDPAQNRVGRWLFYLKSWAGVDWAAPGWWEAPEAQRSQISTPPPHQDLTGPFHPGAGKAEGGMDGSQQQNPCGIWQGPVNSVASYKQLQRPEEVDFRHQKDCPLEAKPSELDENCGLLFCTCSTCPGWTRPRIYTPRLLYV